MRLSISSGASSLRGLCGVGGGSLKRRQNKVSFEHTVKLSVEDERLTRASHIHLNGSTNHLAELQNRASIAQTENEFERLATRLQFVFIKVLHVKSQLSEQSLLGRVVRVVFGAFLGTFHVKVGATEFDRHFGHIGCKVCNTVLHKLRSDDEAMWRLFFAVGSCDGVGIFNVEFERFLDAEFAIHA